MKPRRRQIITRVIVFLLLGAIVNVAVAWGCGEFGVTDLNVQSVSSRSLPRWHFNARSGVGILNVKATVEMEKWMPPDVDWDTVDVRSPVRWGVLRKPPDEDFVGGKYEIAHAFALGWPSLCLRAESIEYPLQPDGTRPKTLSRGIVVTRSLAYGRGYLQARPTIPLWPGFAINTIFYAAILWLLFFAPGSVRRMIRHRRGLCPACAYPVGTSPVCTECGKPVSVPVALRPDITCTEAEP